MHICHTQAASAIEGSPTQETTRIRESTTDNKHGYVAPRESLNIVGTQGQAICSQIEKEFLLEVGHAEELASGLLPVDGMFLCLLMIM